MRRECRRHEAQCTVAAPIQARIARARTGFNRAENGFSPGRSKSLPTTSGHQPEERPAVARRRRKRHADAVAVLTKRPRIRSTGRSGSQSRNPGRRAYRSAAPKRRSRKRPRPSRRAADETVRDDCQPRRVPPRAEQYRDGNWIEARKTRSGVQRATSRDVRRQATVRWRGWIERNSDCPRGESCRHMGRRRRASAEAVAAPEGRRRTGWAGAEVAQRPPRPRTVGHRGGQTAAGTGVNGAARQDPR